MRWVSEVYRCKNTCRQVKTCLLVYRCAWARPVANLHTTMGYTYVYMYMCVGQVIDCGYIKEGNQCKHVM